MGRLFNENCEGKLSGWELSFAGDSTGRETDQELSDGLRRIIGAEGKSTIDRTDIFTSYRQERKRKHKELQELKVVCF